MSFFRKKGHRSKADFAPTSFYSCGKMTSSARSLAPPFQIEPAALGFYLGLGVNLNADSLFIAQMQKERPQNFLSWGRSFLFKFAQPVCKAA